MPIQNYNNFKAMTRYCKTRVPVELTNALTPIKDDDAAVRKLGVEYIRSMGNRVLEAGKALYLYSLYSYIVYVVIQVCSYTVIWFI